MANIFDVAYYILKSIGGEISTMKLQKLCYYSQAWNLVWTDTPLFNEDFYRWDNGPVSPDLFKIHKGLFMISSENIPTDLLSNSLTNEEFINIDKVLSHFSKFNGGQLSEMSHNEKPWLDTEKDAVIDKKSIRDFYLSL